MIPAQSSFKKRVAWLVPAPIPGSGGHRTILNHASFLAEQGWETFFFVDTNDSPREIKQTFERLFYKTPITYRSGLTIDGDFSAVIATAWWTAIAAARAEHIPNRLYFVQDYEPYFHAMGSDHLSAIASYKLGLTPITIGRWLAKKLQSDFGCQPQFFDFGVDHGTYFPLARKRENAICILYQDDKPRRCAEMIREAVLGIRFHRPDVKIYLFGQLTAPAIHGTHHLGLLSRQQCNDLYNQCRVGICLSSTNPSRIPFEMMASGLPVIDLYCESNLFEHVDETVLLSEPDPYSIAEATLNILESPDEFQRRHEKSIAAAARRSEQNEKDQFGIAFDNIIQGHTIDRLHLEPTYKSAASTAGGRVPSKISSIHVKRREHRLKDNIEPAIRHMRDQAAATLTATRWVSLSDVNLKTIRGNIENAAVLSLDVWDTLICRNVSPDEIKLRTAKFAISCHRLQIDEFYRQPLRMLALRRLCENMAGEENEEAGLDDEYELENVLGRMYDFAFLQKTPSSREQFVHVMRNFEIDQEISVSSINREIYGILKDFRDKAILLSDFYMGKAHLSRILTAIGVDIDGLQIYVSCDLGLSKRTGRIYPAIASRLSIPPEHILHIGDNESSDVTEAQGNGFRAIYYRPREANERRIDQLNIWVGKLSGYSHGTRRLIRSADGRGLTGRPTRSMEALGAACSPIFSGYSQFIYDLAADRNLKKIFFFTREGIFFKTVFDAWQSGLPEHSRVETVLLPVSRVATFLPSLRDLSASDLMRMWNQYSSQSMDNTLQSIQCDPGEFCSQLQAYGLKGEEDIRFPWLDSRVVNFFANLEVNDMLNRKRLHSHSLLERMLSQHGFDNSGENLVVDVGWRGTIQDNLCHAFPDAKITGVYLGLNQFINTQPSNAEKYAFIVDANANNMEFDDILKYVRPIEMLCNGLGGSVTGYTDNSGIVTPLTSVKDEEDAVYRQYTFHFQKGVVGGIDATGLSDAVTKPCLRELAQTSGQLLRELVLDPPRTLAVVEGKLHHNETFGAGGYTKSTRILLSEWLRALFSTSARKRIFEKAVQSGWPNGYLKRQLGGLPYAWAKKRHRI